MAKRFEIKDKFEKRLTNVLDECIRDDNLNKFTEIEARFKLPSMEVFDKIEKILNTGMWISVQDFHEIHDYFYNTSKHKGIRTSIIFDDKKLIMNTIHMQKSRIKNRNIKSETCSVKICVSQEKPIDNCDLPDVVKPNFVRIKQRKSYLYKPSYTDKPFIRYDITRSWEGETREDVEKKQRDVEAEYEIELEYMHIPKDKINTFFLANSMAKKVLDIINLF